MAVLMVTSFTEQRSQTAYLASQTGNETAKKIPEMSNSHVFHGYYVQHVYEAALASLGEWTAKDASLASQTNAKQTRSTQKRTG